MIQALARGFVSLLHPKMLLVMIWPVLAALALWLLLALAFWAQAARWIDGALRGSDAIVTVFELWPLALVAAHAGWMLLALAFVPLVMITAVIIIGIFAMPSMVTHVALRDYPDLARRQGGTMAGAVWNGVAALGWFALLALVTLPLWLLPPLWPFIWLGLLGYLNQRVFRYDALSEHADAGEFTALVGAERWPLFGLGVIIALAAHVPVLGFFSPVFGGLVFIHFALQRLRRMRGAPVEGTARRMID